MATAFSRSSPPFSPPEMLRSSLTTQNTSDGVQHPQFQPPFPQTVATSEPQSTKEQQAQSSSVPPLQPNNEPLDYIPLLGPRTKARDVVLEPLRFPDSPKQDLSCFLDPNKDLPIVCMMCDVTFDAASQEQSNVTSGDSTTQLSVCKERGVEDDVLSVRKKEVQQRACEKLSLLPKDEWLRHILVKHNMVVHNICDICSLKRYSGYWKARFSQAPISQLTPIIRTNSHSDEPSEDYYLLSDAIPEDKSLRVQLQQKKLEAILQVQHREREDNTFSRMCLFCSQVFAGNRTVLFQHMLDAHSFNVGQPDNLVFVGEFLDVLQKKMDNLQCLYCERTFRDHVTLKDHMRKKQHKRINPQNRSYDRFYVINYLEFGKRWEEVQSEDDREIINQEKNEWEDWTEPTNSSFHCLFCPSSSSQTFDSTLQHMKALHNFDFKSSCLELKLDYYKQLKLVNYIRRQVYLKCCMYCLQRFESHDQLLDHMGFHGHYILPPTTSQWDQPQYLFPTFENDAFLCALDDNDGLNEPLSETHVV